MGSNSIIITTVFLIIHRQALLITVPRTPVDLSSIFPILIIPSSLPTVNRHSTNNLLPIRAAFWTLQLPILSYPNHPLPPTRLQYQLKIGPL
jgi:hypothetical protein